MANEYKMTAKTFSGLEDVLLQELKALGAKNCIPGVRSVHFEGNQETLYRCNLWSRTALKILKHLYSAECKDMKRLYLNIRKYPWENHFSINETFAIQITSNATWVSHSQFTTLRIKDAIADRFMMVFKKRPDVDRERPDYMIHVYIHETGCEVSLDSSGDPLFKRGYKNRTLEAPVNEVLAAGMIKLSGWNPGQPFFDGMCGSGTIPIEAGFLATNSPPGMLRKRFGFMNWKDFDKKLWEKIVVESLSQIQKPETLKIYASDINRRACNTTRQNANFAKMDNHITIMCKDFFNAAPPIENEQGVLFLNPPYGERMQQRDVEAFYRKIGDTLKQRYQGWSAWIISSYPESFKYFGLKTSKRIVLYNGPLECRFLNFELYSGSKKMKNNG